VRLFPGVK